MTGPAASTLRRRGRIALYAVAAGALVAAALAAAYLNWIWWPVSYGGGLLIAWAAAATLAGGGVLAVLGRWSGRAFLKRVALVVLAMGVGIVAGEALGPSREPLITAADGTMTLRLESPVAATATGPAICTNVASATEFAVSGESNMTLDTPDHPFVLIATDVGDRWRVLRDAPRKDGVLLRIDVSARLVTDARKPGTIGMWAAGSSTLTSTFSKTGGSIRFAGLVAQTGPDYTGESMDLAGTLEWTCGAAPAVTP
jgi:hypothetical protein